MSPPEGPNSSGRSNPRRRQRNASEDSVAIRQPVKRRKRTGLTQDTFEPPTPTKVNGYARHDVQAPQSNGHPREPNNLQQKSSDSTSLAIRSGGSKKADKDGRFSRRDGHIELVFHVRRSLFGTTLTAETNRQKPRNTSLPNFLQLQTPP